MRHFLKTPRKMQSETAVLDRQRSKRFAPDLLCEALEERRLMSLTIDVRNTDGTTATADVSAVGQVLNLEVLAVVTDTAGQPELDGFQDAIGDFISTALYGHAVAGDLAAHNVAPFRASGSSGGAQVDLNGDGNLDVGALPSGGAGGDFFTARSSPIQTGSSGTGTVAGTSLTFVIATLTYTVTNLNKGGQTSINFVPFQNPAGLTAEWLENGQVVNSATGTFQAGTPFIVSDPSLVVAPVAVNDSATVTKNTTTSISELQNDDVIVPLNPASVTVVTAPGHGTAVPQANGQILYTPTTGYIGTDSFTYTVADTDGRISNAATVSINVVNAPPPTAVADTANDLLNQPVTISVLANDTDPAGATITPSSVTVGVAPAHGTAVAQANGTIIYTPTTGFTGTDTFTYTETDSNDETSNPATVTVTVTTPTPPAIINSPLDESTTAGAPVTVDVLSDVTAGSAPVNPATVTVVNAPADGTAVVQSDGSIIYTPTAQYTGGDSFTFTVADTLGDVSAAGTVALTISHATPPTAANITSPVLSGEPTAINVLSSVTSGAPLVPSSVKVVTAPANGSAVVNADGTISYTPTAGYLGTDTFTYSAGNSNLDTSNTATVSVNVGTSISNAKGSAHSLTFTDAAGGLETITLNKGTADIFFTGTGSLTVAGTKATVTGAGLDLGSITLTGTTKASTLGIKGSVKTPATLAGITDTAPLGSISAASVNITGPASLGGVGSIIVGSISSSVLNLNATSNAAVSIPPRVSITAGAVSDSSLSSSVPVTSLKVASWANTDPSQLITVPSIASLAVAGGFDAGLVLTNANPKVVALNSAKITGALDGSLNASGGTINVISAGSVASSWVPSGISSLKSLTIKAGGLASALTATTIGTLAIGGDLTGNITASSVKLISVAGAITGSTITTTGALGQVIATGAITTSNIVSASNITSVSGGSITGSNVSAGVQSLSVVTNGQTTGVPINLAGVTSGELGDKTIGSVKAGSFGSSLILAGKVSSASLGAVTTGNGGSTFGIGADTVGGFSGSFAGTPLHLARAQLSNEEVLQAYLVQKGVTFADFDIVLAG
jgi:hypothetical protein